MDEAVWGSDDLIVFTAGLPARLWRVPASGGEPEPVVGVPTAGHQVSPSFLPGGNLLVVSYSDHESDVLLLPPDGSAGVPLLQLGSDVKVHPTPSGHLLIWDGNALMAGRFDADRRLIRGEPLTVLENVRSVAVSDSGTLVYEPVTTNEIRIGLVDREGRPLADPAVRGPVWSGRVRLSPDGTRLAYVVSGQYLKTRHIAIHDLQRSTTILLTNEGFNRSPVWSPDSDRVAFQSNWAGVEGVFWKRADGSGETVTVTTRERRPFPQTWSSSYLVFGEAAEGGMDLFAVSEDGAVSPLRVSSGVDERQSVFSPDGRFIAFTSNESGRNDVYVRSFPDGAKRPVSTAGGDSPVWVENELFYRNGERFEMVRVGTKGALEISPPSFFSRDQVSEASMSGRTAGRSLSFRRSIRKCRRLCMSSRTGLWNSSAWSRNDG